MPQLKCASAIGVIVKEMIGEEGYFGDEGEAMSERSRGDEGLEYQYCETLVLGMMLIFSNEMYWGPFLVVQGYRYVPLVRKKKEEKGKRCIQLSGGLSGTHGAMDRWVMEF